MPIQLLKTITLAESAGAQAEAAPMHFKGVILESDTGGTATLILYKGTSASGTTVIATLRTTAEQNTVIYMLPGDTFESCPNSVYYSLVDGTNTSIARMKYVEVGA